MSTQEHPKRHFHLSPEESRYVVDIDMGGTYTDVMVSYEGGAACFKTDTTPSDLSECFKDGIFKGADHFGFANARSFLSRTHVVRLSTSLSTNTLLERKGARVGLFLSRQKSAEYSNRFHENTTARHILLPERILEIHERLEEEEIREKSYRLLTSGVTTIVVCLAGDTDFAEGERRVKSVINRYFPKHSIGSVPILLSNQLSRDAQYFTRINTALLDAYVHFVLSRQILAIEDYLRGQGFAYPLLVVHSSGGSARPAKTAAIQTLSSGAAAGVYGSQRLASFYKKSRVVVTDVGGTSTEIGLLENAGLSYGSPTHVAEFPVDILSPVNATLAIGGGSIATVDRSGNLRFGPESVGAFPGPACYNLGGTNATLTDAFLVLGFFDENYFLGGQKRIYRDTAERVVLKNIADPLGVSLMDASMRIKARAVEIIGDKIRSLISNKGKAPRKFALFSVGGGGGLLASDLMDHVGLEEAFVFKKGAVFGAYGTSGMDILHQYKRRTHFVWKKKGTRFSPMVREINKTILDLERQAGRDMALEGFSPEEVRFEAALELKPPGSGSSYRLALPSPFLWPETAFFPFPENVANCKTILITGIFLNAYGDIPHAKAVYREAVSQEDLDTGKRRVLVLPDTFMDVPVYNWDNITDSKTIEGPALMENRETTVWLPKGKVILFDEYANGIMKKL